MHPLYADVRNLWRRRHGCINQKALLFGAKKGHSGCLKLLLEHNADPNHARTDDRATGVYLAAQDNHPGAVKMLLEHNANPSIATTDGGFTATYTAAQYGKYNTTAPPAFTHLEDPDGLQGGDRATPSSVASTLATSAAFMLTTLCVTQI